MESALYDNSDVISNLACHNGISGQGYNMGMIALNAVCLVIYHCFFILVHILPM